MYSSNEAQNNFQCKDLVHILILVFSEHKIAANSIQNDNNWSYSYAWMQNSSQVGCVFSIFSVDWSLPLSTHRANNLTWCFVGQSQFLWERPRLRARVLYLLPLFFYQIPGQKSHVPVWLHSKSGSRTVGYKHRDSCLWRTFRPISSFRYLLKQSVQVLAWILCWKTSLVRTKHSGEVRLFSTLWAMLHEMMEDLM